MNVLVTIDISKETLQIQTETDQWSCTNDPKGLVMSDPEDPVKTAWFFCGAPDC